MAKKSFRVNDTRIYLHKYYPWYYDDNLKINLVPISYYTREQAVLTLTNQFGSQAMKVLKVIKGKKAIAEGMKLGKNSFRWEGKSYQVKKYLIPGDMSYNKARRRRWARQLKFSTKTKSEVNAFIKLTYLKNHEIISG